MNGFVESNVLCHLRKLYAGGDSQIIHLNDCQWCWNRLKLAIESVELQFANWAYASLLHAHQFMHTSQSFEWKGVSDVRENGIPVTDR